MNDKVNLDNKWLIFSFAGATLAAGLRWVPTAIVAFKFSFALGAHGGANGF